MPRRRGATMIEVLVAIFIMGIGLMALLTLFPLGALRMAKAIQDERAAQAGTNARAIAEILRVRSDPNVAAAMLNGVPGGFGPITNLEGRSYPVYVDPIGRVTTGFAPALGGAQVGWPMPLAAPVVPRVDLLNLPALPKANTLRWFTLPDDISFEAEFHDPTAVPPRLFGFPKTLIAGTIERDNRFSWAYLAQRPRAADPTVVELSAVVYSGRGMSLSGNLALPETPYEGYVKAGNISEVLFSVANPANTIRIRYEYFGHLLPQVRAGGWILDASTVRGEHHGYFYRVVGVTEGVEAALGNAAYVDLEVQQPLRGFVTDPFVSTGNVAVDHARVIILDNVVEVFECGVGKGP